MQYLLMVYTSVVVADSVVYTDSLKKGRLEQIIKDGENMDKQRWDNSGEGTGFTGKSWKAVSG